MDALPKSATITDKEASKQIESITSAGNESTNKETLSESRTSNGQGGLRQVETTTSAENEPIKKQTQPKPANDQQALKKVENTTADGNETSKKMAVQELATRTDQQAKREVETTTAPGNETNKKEALPEYATSDNKEAFKQIESTTTAGNEYTKKEAQLGTSNGQIALKKGEPTSAAGNETSKTEAQSDSATSITEESLHESTIIAEPIKKQAHSEFEVSNDQEALKRVETFTTAEYESIKKEALPESVNSNGQEDLKQFEFTISGNAIIKKNSQQETASNDINNDSNEAISKKDLSNQIPIDEQKDAIKSSNDNVIPLESHSLPDESSSESTSPQINIESKIQEPLGVNDKTLRCEKVVVEENENVNVNEIDNRKGSIENVTAGNISNHQNQEFKNTRKCPVEKNVRKEVNQSQTESSLGDVVAESESGESFRNMFCISLLSFFFLMTYYLHFTKVKNVNISSVIKYSSNLRISPGKSNDQ